uniref:Protein lifeguard 2 n=1 Tax=Astyanax mexicanus TaxID=7994 RepID=W5LRC0_ASTMX
IAPAVSTVSGNLPPSYEEANACPSYCYADGSFSWEDKHIRRIFIRKVYSILMLQLLATLAIVCAFTFASVKFYIQTHPGLYSLSFLFLGTFLALSCCGDLRQFPWNLILLTVFTLSMACMLGFISFYNSRSVVLCLGITAVVCFSVTIFSFQSRLQVDVTSYQGVLFSLCVVMLCCSLVMGFVVPFGYFLAFDTQLLMGNKMYAISPEEYIFATLSLYLDVVNLFTFLLQLFGGGRE